MKFSSIKLLVLTIFFTEFFLLTRFFASNSKIEEKDLFFNCSKKTRVAFTFDDGPHPIYTKLIIETLRKERIHAGFFVLGASIQNFLNFYSNLTNYLVERPRIENLLIEDYSLIEQLYERQEIFYHGWFHEKISDLNLPILIDHLSTLLIEFGQLKNLFPVYRSTWGTATSGFSIKKNILFVQLLKQFGLTPINWNIDTKDFLLDDRSASFNEHLNQTLRFICHSRDALVLMHDNRPRTVEFLRELIVLIRRQGHEIVSPTDLHPEWKNVTNLRRFHQFVQHLRQKIERAQRLPVSERNSFKLFEIILKNRQKQTVKNLWSQLSPMTDETKFSIELHPNIFSQLEYSSHSSNSTKGI